MTMPQDPIRKVVIVGGGSAGWMTAAALARYLDQRATSIRLVESELISTVGVGEATVPAIRSFNQRLGLDEPDFMRNTNGSIKLGIRFENWREKGHSYIHAFGYYGQPIRNVHFQHYWAKLRDLGDETLFDEYNLPHVAAQRGRFDRPAADPGSVLSKYFYAFHFDASLYARYLRRWAEARGVRRTEGKVTGHALDPESGFVRSITLDSGEVIEGDLFVDCSGFRGLLIEQALETGYDDWSHWLPCDRAWAVSTAYPSQDAPIPPYTRARALQAGWQWRIPLQNRTGDGHVFSSRFISEDEGRRTLLENIEGEPMNEPRLLKFRTGKRRRLWNRNVVAIGLSSGFLEPLESTSIYLIQTTIFKLLSNFPDRGFAGVLRDEFNRQMDEKFAEARDALILHYHATTRDDTPFWNYTRTMEIPGELDRRIRLFRRRGVVSHRKTELFIEHNWLAILIGQGIYPENYDPRVDGAGVEQVRAWLEKMKAAISDAADGLPTHKAFLDRYCRGQLIGGAATR